MKKKLVRKTLAAGLSLAEILQQLQNRLTAMDERYTTIEKLLKKVLRRLNMRPLAENALVSGMPYTRVALKKMRRTELISLAGCLKVNPFKLDTPTTDDLIKAVHKAQKKFVATLEDE